MSAARQEVLSGDLSDVGISALIEAFSLGRSVMVVEILSASGDVVGRVSIKAGRVLSATCGALTGEAALEELVRRGGHGRFRVFREAASARPIARAAPPPPSRATDGAGRRPESVARIPVMEGSLSEFDVASLMQVVSSGRQHTVIEIRDGRSEVTATLVLKANKVMSARAGALGGIDAVSKALDLPAELDFAIYRVPADVDGEPLGSVEDVLLRAASASPASGFVRPGNDGSPDADIPRSCIMQGSVADANVASLLQVLGSSRQFTELEVFRPDGSLAGRVHLKAGQMLHASAGSATGVQAVRILIDAPPDFRFRAWRRLSEAELPQTVGFIGDVLLRAINADPVRSEPDVGALPTNPPPAHPTTTVMEGSLAEFDLASLLQVVSTSRQRTRLDVFDTNARLVGSIQTKAAWVLSATTGHERGEAAIRRLLQEPPSSSFVVSRVHDPVLPSDRGVGSLGDLLLRAITSTETERTARTAPRSGPAAPRVASLFRTPNVPPVPASTSPTMRPIARAAPPPPSRTSNGAGRRPESVARIPVMEGSLSEFDVASLMQVVSSGRQHTVIEIRNDRSEVTATLVLKANKVMSARAGALGGIDAVSRALDLPAELDFAIYRVPADVDGEPLGSVEDVLLRAASASPASGFVRPGNDVSPDADIPRSCIMQGSVADANVASLLQVLGSSRQFTELEVFRPDGSLAGRVHLKAGQMLHASAGSATGVQAVRILIDAPPDFRFRAWRRLSEAELPQTVGFIGDVLLRAINADPVRSEPDVGALPTNPPPAHPTTTVMEGSLAEFDLASLLQVVSTSRQRTRLDVFDTNARLVGSIQTKAAWVLSATAGDERGEAAIRRLLQEPPSSSFVVSRVHDPVLPSDRGVGSLGDVLLRAITSAEPEGVSPVRERAEPIALASPPEAFGSPIAIPEPPPSPSRGAEAPATFEAESAPVVRSSRRWRITLAALALALAALGVRFALRSSASDVAPPPRPTPTIAASVASPTPTATPAPTQAATSVATTATSAEKAPAPAPSSTEPQTSIARDESKRVTEKARRDRAETYIRSVQSTLKDNGYDPGPVDGTFGPLTAEALRAFQRAEHLTVDGMLNDSTRAALERARKK